MPEKWAKEIEFCRCLYLERLAVEEAPFTQDMEYWKSHEDRQDFLEHLYQESSALDHPTDGVFKEFYEISGFNGWTEFMKWHVANYKTINISLWISPHWRTLIKAWRHKHADTDTII